MNQTAAPVERLFAPRRELGRTGFRATAIGSGDVADRALPLEQCVATLRRAIDAGINVIDTAPNYEEGYSEQIVAETLRGLAGRRDEIFLVDKIDHFDRPVAAQVDGSLERLGLPYADAFVFHGLSEMAIFEQLAAPGGGFDQLAACIAAGKARFGGISSHNPDVLEAALRGGFCDIVLFPVGPFVDERYISETLPLARSLGVGTICFKTYGAGKLLGDTEGYNQPLQQRPRGKLSSGGVDETEARLPRLSVAECLHYTLTIDPDVALLGMSFPNEQDAAFAAAAAFAGPLPAGEMAAIRARAVAARRDKGPCWWNPDPDA
jgi:aryl-alcohol dehydrogenase-like predicted oxidoreductase